VESAVTWFLQSPYGWIAAGLWGAMWGSFANVCIHRIPRGESVVRPPSHCPHCHKPVAWHDNIPIFGWLLVLGRCRQCGDRISPRYPLVELCAVGLALLVYARFVGYAPWRGAYLEPPGVALSRYIVYFFFVLVLLVLSVIDMEHQLLPDRITYPAIPTFFLLGQLLAWQFGGVPLGQALLGLGAGYAVVRLIADGYYYLTGREGLGYGDGKLLSLIGGLLGWRALPYTLLIGSLSGLIVGVPYTLWQRWRSKEAEPAALRHTAVVFGPFLALGAVLYMLFLLGRDIDTLLLQALLPLLGDAV